MTGPIKWSTGRVTATYEAAKLPLPKRQGQNGVCVRVKRDECIEGGMQGAATIQNSMMSD